MRFASGRRAGSIAHACSFAVVLAFGAGSALAQPSFKSGDWGTTDGGAVAVHPDLTFDAAFTDAETNEAVFTTGKCGPPKPVGPDVELSCRPNGKAQTYIIIVHADGTGQLDVVSGGARHKAATLTK
ncbi:MAG: hypothetical protein JSR45_10170 [Proteobacteria bacterium]|nr:hypothetical protein [Pseudomonadota bacterium]